MSIGFIFWVLMLIWAALWLINYYGPQPWGPHASSLLIFVLFFLLGWAEFGFVVHR